ncbi:MAG: hypothetical protein WBN65_03740 [Gammaproteobacteria bacterium]
MTKKIFIAGAALLVALSAATAQAADENGYTKSCAAAEEARKMSAELHYEWNTVAPLIAKAGDAAKAGDFAKAVKLCDQARLHSEASIAQARQQADAWRAAVVK